ncbi:GDP/UDP-N,N'-diacetylbacillosamine 2-epimerase (hydrolysing) [Peptoclostridium litorale DSM 5388]|uniref:GDP/UDP-N,N'-diacetylbacillosamine 2-epimerase n=1 Tax=Peptoclostridium litorale DSM 5388 TaxID=1121324 RepID=A0A069REY8_PEPLI|nr:UDP-N-acetylglucosamine 2-epimerase [Peptoclostridium litorale]KDR94765.1 GDP/UDP-N,N'-diacetylbacillosamine 2-epimerase [Peptoclostridium litorale DSM 5388]SIN92191.1 GDP/UDP-N,N'-diacetylbacillosamine 2-epimerase (hydrolysing) [Peptoclostridium litorale DSM 5388]
MKKICIVTGTRAEYGLLKPLIYRICKDEELKLQLIATGMHLSPEFGLTYKEIEQDGYEINEKIEILLSADTPIGISKSMGLAMMSFTESYERLNPDMVVVLGDRYEIFCATSCAMISKIPVVHLHGGEATEGAIDEAMRHAITKMSYLHFTSTEQYRKRVIQLGENPCRVFNVGAIGLENIKNIKFLSKEELENSIGFEFNKKVVLVTFHPVTLEKKTSKEQFQHLLDALSEIENLKIIFTKANADEDGRIINKMIDKYVEDNKEKSISFISMGSLRYLSAMKYADGVIGNSSSGIIEAPEFNIPTVNIGDRQRGRVQAQSIINCEPEKMDILKSVQKALSKEFRDEIRYVKGVYGDGNVSNKIIEEIKKHLSSSEIEIKKCFYDINVD